MNERAEPLVSTNCCGLDTVLPLSPRWRLPAESSTGLTLETEEREDLCSVPPLCALGHCICRLGGREEDRGAAGWGNACAFEGRCCCCCCCCGHKWCTSGSLSFLLLLQSRRGRACDVWPTSTPGSGSGVRPAAWERRESRSEPRARILAWRAARSLLTGAGAGADGGSGRP